MQRHTEEVWARNARAFAAQVDRTVESLNAELIVLTGDVRARSLIRDALGARSRTITTEMPGPTPDDHTTDHYIDEEANRAGRAARPAVRHCPVGSLS